MLNTLKVIINEESGNRYLIFQERRLIPLLDLIFHAQGRMAICRGMFYTDRHENNYNLFISTFARMQ